MTSTDRSARPVSRRFTWLAIIIIGVIAAYTAGWFYIAQQLEAQTSRILNRATPDNGKLECEKHTARGYPFRIGLFCDQTAWQHEEKGISITAGAFRSAAQVYAPSHIVSELDGPAQVEIFGLRPIRADWRNLRTSLRASRPIPSRGSMQIDSLVVTAKETGQRIADIKEFQAHMRTVEGRLDLAASASGFTLTMPVTTGMQPKPVNLAADTSIRDAADFLLDPGYSLRGNEGELRQFAISLDGKSSADISGTWRISADGLLSGKFVLTIRNLASMAILARQVFPHYTNAISSLENIMITTSNAESGAVKLPVFVNNGIPTIGFFELAPLPRFP